PATRMVLERAGIRADQLDVIESNEAFAAQACAVIKELGLDPAKVNPNGSGISLGHPIGATGAIITTKAPVAPMGWPRLITISEASGIRYLHFGSEWVQGAMRLRRPNDLVIAYTQQMMAWLLLLDPDTDTEVGIL